MGSFSVRPYCMYELEHYGFVQMLLITLFAAAAPPHIILVIQINRNYYFLTLVIRRVVIIACVVVRRCPSANVHFLLIEIHLLIKFRGKHRGQGKNLFWSKPSRPTKGSPLKSSHETSGRIACVIAASTFDKWQLYSKPVPYNAYSTTMLYTQTFLGFL